MESNKERKIERWKERQKEKQKDRKKYVYTIIDIYCNGNIYLCIQPFIY